jgi:hypothetical protein
MQKLNTESIKTYGIYKSNTESIKAKNGIYKDKKNINYTILFQFIQGNRV